MSNAEHTAPKQRVIGTPFKPGVSGNPNGRPKGGRNRLSEQFLSDLHDSWAEIGAIALRRAADEDPVGYVRIVASLMPKDINLSLTVDPVEFGNRYRAALEMLGNEPEPRQVRKAMRTIAPKIIEHDDAG